MLTKEFPRACHMPGTVLGTWDAAVSGIDKVLLPGTYIVFGKIIQ